MTVYVVHNWLPGKTRLQNDLLCVEWDVELYTFTRPSGIKWQINR